MKPFYKIVLSTFTIWMSFSGQLNAQAENARVIMETLYKAYDSIPNLTFDVKYSYFTDTLYGDYKREELKGTYTMSGKKARFSLGDVEYMQNDSFFIAIYNKDQMLVVANPVKSNVGGHLPLRDAVDSLLNRYSAHYRITVQDREGDSTGAILFEAADDLAGFTSFIIRYDKILNVLLSLQYTFLEQPAPAEENEKPDAIPSRKKNLLIDFEHYRFAREIANEYDESRYIWFEDGECKAASPYKEFRVFDTRAR